MAEAMQQVILNECNRSASMPGSDVLLPRKQAKPPSLGEPWWSADGGTPPPCFCHSLCCPPHCGTHQAVDLLLGVLRHATELIDNCENAADQEQRPPRQAPTFVATAWHNKQGHMKSGKKCNQLVKTSYASRHQKRKKKTICYRNCYRKR